MKTEKSIPGFTAEASFSNQNLISFGGKFQVSIASSAIVPALSCELCERICFRYPELPEVCELCWNTCGPIER
jgi:hypothetical protein